MRFSGAQHTSGGEHVFVAVLALSDAAAAGGASIRRDAAGIPTAFRLLRPGPCPMTMDGRSIEGEIDAADIKSILDYHALKGELIPIDCEHLLKMLADLKGVDEADLLKTSPLLGEQAAAGAVSLHGENGEIWAHVEKLTARARELLTLGADKMYLYFSPVFRGLTTGPLRVTSVALTNTPAINNQDALAARGERGGMSVTKTTKGEIMKEKLLKLLGLLGITNTAALTADGADLAPVIEQAHDAIAKERGAIARFIAGLKDSLGLTDADTLETLPGKLLPILEKAKGDATALSALQARVAGLEGKEKDRLIEALTAEGKLTVAMLPWAKTQDALALSAWAATAPVVVAPTRIVTPADRQAADSVALSDNDARVARACGLDPEAVAKANGLKTAAVALLAILFASICTAAPLTADRDTPERVGALVSANVASGAVVYAGAMAAVNSNGYAAAAADTAGYAVIGRFESKVDNSGAHYAAQNLVAIRRGIFRWANADGITAADIGKLAYVTDDQTVNKTGGGQAIIAGSIVDVDSSGVWVDTGRVGPIGAATPISLAVSGNASVAGTLSVTGATTVSNLTATGTLTLKAGSVANAALAAAGTGAYTNAQTGWTNVFDAAGRLTSHTP